MLRWCAGARTVVSVLPRPTHTPTQEPGATRHRRLLRPCSAKKPADNDDEQAGGGTVLSKSVLLRSGVALFALGFIDAGYSGDWSRIGAISKDDEELLKLAAYVVVPLSLALIFSVSSEDS